MLTTSSTLDTTLVDRKEFVDLNEVVLTSAQIDTEEGVQTGTNNQKGLHFMYKGSIPWNLKNRGNTSREPYTVLLNTIWDSRFMMKIKTSVIQWVETLQTKSLDSDQSYTLFRSEHLPTRGTTITDGVFGQTNYVTCTFKQFRSVVTHVYASWDTYVVLFKRRWMTVSLSYKCTDPSFINNSRRIVTRSLTTRSLKRPDP